VLVRRKRLKTGRTQITDRIHLCDLVEGRKSAKVRENRQYSRYRIGEPGVKKALPELTQEVA
jgi:hypothetical protein